jgi:hypothetical protein
MNRLLLLLIVLTSTVVHTGAAEMDRQECREVSGKKLGRNETLLAYSIDGELDALAMLKGEEFLPVDGREFKHITEMYDLLDQKKYPVSFDADFTRFGEDRCVWFANLRGESRPQAILIFASKRIKLETKLNPKIIDYFYSINTACVYQHDILFLDEKAPCTKPKLLATSDLNSNGRMEFWYINPYTWDTGFAIAELSESGNYLDVISSKCLDCD